MTESTQNKKERRKGLGFLGLFSTRWAKDDASKIFVDFAVENDILLWMLGTGETLFSFPVFMVLLNRDAKYFLHNKIKSGADNCYCLV
jgi:hypothetical protein